MNEYPNWLKFSPDEKIRYFRDHPETYEAELTMVRDAYRISRDELEEIKLKLYEQMGLPNQSKTTHEGIQAMLDGIRTIIEGYQEDTTFNN